MVPEWRNQLAEVRDLGAILGRSIQSRQKLPTRAAIDRRARPYGGAELLASEHERESTRQKRMAADRARFVDGAVLKLPLRSPNVSFDPNTLAPLEPFGTVYKSARVSDAWGTLDVSRGALLATDWSSVTVALAPDRGIASLVGPLIVGDGWKLELAPGWKLVPAGRPGLFVAVNHGPATSIPPRLHASVPGAVALGSIPSARDDTRRGLMERLTRALPRPVLMREACNVRVVMVQVTST